MESNREERITALYKRESARLQATVTRRVDGPAVIAEDACMYAWAYLVRRDDIDPDSPTTFGWLVTVAVHEGWRMRADETASPSSEMPEQVDVAAATPEDIAEAHEALAFVEQLPERFRLIATLAALGLSREEMAEVTGWTLRTVDRQLGRARALLRKFRG